MAANIKKAFQQVNRVNDILLPQFENLKQRKLGRSAYNVYVDYKAVFVDFFKNMKAKPLKTATYATGLGVAYLVYRNNPDKRSYNGILMNNSVELLQISKKIRNPDTDSYNRDVLQWYYADRLQRQSFLFFSVMFLNDFSEQNDSYETQCYYTKPRWIYMWKQVVDVGICGHWFNLERSMFNFDVNHVELEGYPEGEAEDSFIVKTAKNACSVFHLYVEDLLYIAKKSYENIIISEDDDNTSENKSDSQ